MMKKGYLLLMLTWLIASCKKDVAIQLTEENGKPVLNLLMNKDSVMIARLTLSNRMSDWYGYGDIKNAATKVKLYEDGIYKEDLRTDSFGYRIYYKSTLKARAGATYRVVATIPGFEEVEGTDWVPEDAEMGEINFKPMGSRDGEVKLNVMVEIHDKPGEKNYYRIKLNKGYYWTEWDGTQRMSLMPLSFKSGDPKDNWFNGSNQSEYFTDDALFDGKTIRINLMTDFVGPTKTITVDVLSLTPTSYKYLYTAYMGRQKNDDPLSEKVIVFSNIKNGFGIVGGAAQKRYVVNQ